MAEKERKKLRGNCLKSSKNIRIRKMTKDEMIKEFYAGNGDVNYEEAQRRIMKAMLSGKGYVYLPGKNNRDEFDWVATAETIARLIADGFDIDKVWNPYEYWSVEWGY